jgi:hypothetical protein
MWNVSARGKGDCRWEWDVKEKERDVELIAFLSFFFSSLLLFCSSLSSLSSYIVRFLL